MFVNEGIVYAPIQDVWKVWSTSEGYRALGVALAELDLRPGGVIRSRYKPDGRLGDEQTIENEILAYDPPRMIAIRIRKTHADFPFKEAWKHMWTVVTLTPLDGNRTHLRVSSIGYGSDPESLAMRRVLRERQRAHPQNARGVVREVVRCGRRRSRATDRTRSSTARRG